jgi:hypothetical protein
MSPETLMLSSDALAPDDDVGPSALAQPVRRRRTGTARAAARRGRTERTKEPLLEVGDESG